MLSNKLSPIILSETRAMSGTREADLQPPPAPAPSPSETRTVIQRMLQLPAPIGHFVSRLFSGARVRQETAPGPDLATRFLIQSPYTEQDHLLDLDTLDDENRLLARALSDLRCLRDDYATSPYVDTFNWPEIHARLRGLVHETGSQFRETAYYLVVFRSQIPPTTTYSDLGVLDKAAHAEAIASGGFLKYWFGSPDVDGRNLATCVWRSRDDAIKGGQGEAHRRAMKATAALYSFWKIDKHKLVIGDGAATWDLVDWID